MKKVTWDTYEICLVDYLDGLLNKEEIAALEQFMCAHPDLKLEWELLNQVSEVNSQVEQVDLPDFSFLKQAEYATIKEELEWNLVAKLEGDLNEMELAEVDKNMILYPQLVREWELLQHTQLKLEDSIVFPSKAQLKQEGKGRIILLQTRWMAIAASLLLFGFIGYLFYNNIGLEPKQVAVLSNKQIPMVFVEPKLPIEQPKTKNHQVDGVQTLIVTNVKKDEVKEPIVLVEPEQQQAMAWVEPRNTKGFEANLTLPTELNSVKTKMGLGATQQTAQTPNITYLKPGEWLLEQLAKNIPDASKPLADSLMNGETKGAGLLALQWLNNAAGISYYQDKDEAKNKKRFGIVSKYFAYERSVNGGN